MKHIFRTYTVLLALSFWFVSCRTEEQPVAFGLDTDMITVGAEGGSETVRISTNGNWYAEITAYEGNETPWISVSPMNGIGTAECQVMIDTTLLANSVRKGNIRFYSGKDHVDLRIDQLGYENIIHVEETEYEVPDYAPYGERYITLDVTANVEFKIEVEQGKYLDGTEEGETITKTWIEPSKYKFELDRLSRPRNAKIKVEWQGNSKPFVREGVIRILPVSAVEGDPSATVVLRQDKAPDIGNNRQGDSLAIVSIARSLGMSMADFEGERMDNWDFVTLWDASPKSIEAAKDVHKNHIRNHLDADGNEIPFDIENYIGRPRAVNFSSLNTKDGVPVEVEFLTTVEHLSISSNGNAFLKDFTTGPSIATLTQLKELRMSSFGLSSISDDFSNLKNLEYLSLWGNNFNEYPTVVNGRNFPNLIYLDFSTCRRRVLFDMSTTMVEKENWGGFSNKGIFNAEWGNFPVEVFTFPELEYLSFSNNYLIGNIPTEEQIQEGLVRKGYEKLPEWTEEQIREHGDTLVSRKPEVWNLVGKARILPKCRYRASINLNLLEGNTPDWLLYHPFLMLWIPDILVFNQDSSTRNMQGKTSELTGIPEDPNYYYEVYPLWKPEEIE